MNKLEQRVKRLEKDAPRQPCNHLVGILVNPTEEEAERLSKEMAACPNCSKRRDGDSPQMLIVRLTDYAEKASKNPAWPHEAEGSEGSTRQ